MDLSKYKKTKEDKHSTTMEAPGGHTITLMHAGMPRIQVEQLKRLKLAKGGAVKMADGGDPGDAQASADDAAAAAPAPATNITINAAPAPGQPAQQSPPSGVAPTVAAPVPRQASADLPSSAAQFAAHPVQFQSPQIPAAEPNIAPNGTMDPGAVMRNTQQAAKSQQAIDTAGAAANSVNQAGLVNALAENTAQISNNYNEVKNHVDDYADYMRNHPVDAQNYFKSMGTGQKVTTSLGLLLGGFSQGYHGGGNAASDWLNNQVARDIDAQKSNQAGQRSILGAYQQLYGEGVAATAATKASLMDLYAQKANQIALQLGTPQAAVNAQKVATAAAIEKSKLLQDAAVNLNVLPGQGGSGAAPKAGGSPARGGAATGGATPPNAGGGGGILVPHAEQHFKNLQYTPKAKDNYAAIQAQYNGAVQADKALAQLHDTFKSLASEAAAGSIGGNLRRRAGHALGSIPVAGGALQGIVNYATDTPDNMAYDSDQSSLLGYISSALKGTNIGSGQIQEIVEANSPERGDTPELLAQKERAIKEFIKNHTDTSLLKAWGLSK